MSIEGGEKSLQDPEEAVAEEEAGADPVGIVGEMVPEYTPEQLAEMAARHESYTTPQG